MINNFTPVFFGALPIFRLDNVYEPNENEIDYLKSLKYKEDVNGLKLSQSVDILNDLKLNNIKKCIEYNFDEYKKNILQIENSFYISQSWSTINRKKSMHKSHTHPNTLFSCVLYVRAKNSGITFYQEKSALQQAFNFSFKIKEYNIHNSATWKLPVNTGDLLIFPGHIKHSSFINENNDERIIIGANFFIKGEIGIKEHVDRIVI
nr:gp48 [uncultured Mediterranean phage uvMED]